MRTFLRTTRAALAALALLGGFSHVAQAQQTITFDTVSTNVAGLNNNFTGVDGFTFFNWGVATTTSLGSGTNASSGLKFALGRDTFTSIFRADNQQFSVFSAWLSFRQFDVTNPNNTPVNITVEGYRAGDVVPTFSRIIALTNDAQEFTFNWDNIDEFSFETGALVGPDRTVALAMDDFSTSVVPEPSTVLLLGTGLVLLIVIAPRQRQS